MTAPLYADVWLQPGSAAAFTLLSTDTLARRAGSGLLTVTWTSSGRRYLAPEILALANRRRGEPPLPPMLDLRIPVDPMMIRWAACESAAIS